MPVDMFQALVYNSCYTYIRASNSVSLSMLNPLSFETPINDLLVPAVYYAHLASSRARAHEVADEGNTIMTSTSGERRDPSDVAEIRPLHDTIKHAMWYV